MRITSNEHWEITGIEADESAEGNLFNVYAKPKRSVYYDKDFVQDLPNPSEGFHKDLSDGFVITSDGDVMFTVMKDIEVQEE